MRTADDIRAKIVALEKEMYECNVQADSGKLSVNGSFGKLGSKWSVLYSPRLLIQVTITGQLALLMLIERLELAGLPVISANTDGIVTKCPAVRYGDFLAIIKQWETDTSFETEETRYSALYSKDVNGYIAIKTDGTYKGKGLYANPWEKEGPNASKMQKNPSCTIVIEAMVALLAHSTPLATTIKSCRDVRKFVSVRAVTGGANQGGEAVGKAVRWIYATQAAGRVMNYAKSGNKVPKSDGAKPLMELPLDFPTDINYDWYIEEAQKYLLDIGYSQGRLF